MQLHCFSAGALGGASLQNLERVEDSQGGWVGRGPACGGARALAREGPGLRSKTLNGLKRLAEGGGIQCESDLLLNANAMNFTPGGEFVIK